MRGQRRPSRSGPGVLVVLSLAVAAGAIDGMSASAAAVTVPLTCTVSGPATASGSRLITGPMLPQITGAALDVPVVVDATATPTINPGDVIVTDGSISLDLSALAVDVLENRVKPAVVAAGYPSLAPTAWVEIDVTALDLTIPLPSGATPLGTPSVIGPGANAAFGPGGLVVHLDQLHEDTRARVGATTITVSWQMTDGAAAAPRTVETLLTSATFTAATTVGILFYGAPVTGTVTAPWSCAADDPPVVLASTNVIDAPLSTTSLSSTSLTSTSASSSSSSSTTTVSTIPPTTWATSTTTPSSACAISGFDRYGGWTGMTLDATGRFRVAQIDGRWWFVDPLGHPFFSQGVNHVTFDGTADKYGATPYRDAVTAKYGTREAWAAAQRRRMDDWGYNTLGAWSDEDLFPAMPYALLLNTTNQDSATGRWEDIWDPAWEARVRNTADAAAAAHRDDPYLVGYWTDNELHFGPDWRLLHHFDDYLARPAATPGKAAFVAWLQARYPSFAAFAADFTTTATSWTDLSAPSVVTAWTPGGGEATRAAWMGEMAERYFSVTDAALTAADPDHLNLGARLLTQTTGTPVLAAVGRHVDVASFNFYDLVPELLAPLQNADPTYLPTDGGLAAQAAAVGRPILVTEWSYRAADSGLPNTWPPLFPTLDTQSQRAAAYERRVALLLGTTWVVGQHWFEHADEPPAGRFDGEDSNFGLVDNDDDPYPLLTAISRTMHDCAYARLLQPPATTTSTTASSLSPTSTTASAAAAGNGNAPPPPATPATPLGARARYTA